MRRLLSNLTCAGALALVAIACGSGSDLGNGVQQETKKDAGSDKGAADDSTENDGGITEGGHKPNGKPKPGDKPTPSATTTQAPGQDAGNDDSEPAADDLLPAADDVTSGGDHDGGTGSGPTAPTTDPTETGAGGAGPGPGPGPAQGGSGGGSTIPTGPTSGGSGPIGPSGEGGAPPVLDGCSLQNSYGYDGYCDLEYSCPTTYVSVYCSDNGNGLVCSCGNGTSFKVDEITGISTCEDYLNPCSNTDPVEFTGDFTCSVNTKYADTANCYTYENCERSVTLSSGLEAVQQVQKQVNCYDAGNGTVQCSCYDPTSNKSVNQYLSDISMSKACGVMEDVCWNGVEPAPQGEVTCESVPGNSYHDENQCQEQQNCTQEATIGDQTTSLVDTTYVYCAIDTGDAMICSCQDFNGATATIDATASGDNAGLCTGLIGSCPDILAAPVSGDVSCAVTNQGSSGNYNCSADVSCEQAGQLGDIQFTKSGYLSVSCGRTGDDTSDWSCGCYSSGVNGNATITMPGDVGAWDTCSNAVNECATKVDILIGSNGGGGGVIGKPVNAVEAGAR